MLQRRIHSTCGLVLLAACLLAAFGPLSGCAMWDAERWNLDRYRDERAVDIEGNLSREKPIVPNPF